MSQPRVCCVKKKSHPIVKAPEGLVHCYDCGLNKPPDQFRIGCRGKESSPCIPCRAVRSRRYSVLERRGKSSIVKGRTQKWAKDNREKRAAHQAIGYAIRSGKIKRQPCEKCGNGKSQAHHEDYGKPLEVKWLCAKCHKMEHRKYA